MRSFALHIRHFYNYLRPEERWQTTVEKFKALKVSLEMDEPKPTRAVVTSVACAIGKHPVPLTDGYSNTRGANDCRLLRR